MNTKSSNKLNILLLAITLLLVFVVGYKALGQTNSWLINKDEIGFTVNVSGINLVVKQNGTQISNNGNISLGTDIIEASEEYDLNITIKNEELGDGYFIRSQVIAVIDGAVYNLNDCVDGDLYNDTDGWMYITQSKQSSARTQIAKDETKTIIDTIVFPESFIQELQGKHLKLYLYIEGSPVEDFNV